MPVQMSGPPFKVLAVVMAMTMRFSARIFAERCMALGLDDCERERIVRKRPERRREADRNHQGEREQDPHSPKAGSEERHAHRDDGLWFKNS